MSNSSEVDGGRKRRIDLGEDDAETDMSSLTMVITTKRMMIPL